MQGSTGYNERLFSRGLRKYFHTARFRWASQELLKLGCPCGSVIELGCFDGKLIDFLPVKPERYKGFDANWEGGLDIARSIWHSHPNYSFHMAKVPTDLRLSNSERFELAVAMETFEHIPPDLVDGYLEMLAKHLDGYLMVTVPNEKGIVFLVKWLAKTLLSKDAEEYSFTELINATLGRMHRVKRTEHKGFDYSVLVQQISKHFDVLKISGHPLSFLPPDLCFGIGIVARSRA